MANGIRDAKLIANGQVIHPETNANQVNDLDTVIAEAASTVRASVAAALSSAQNIINKTKKLQAVPTLSHNPPYNGDLITPELNNFNSMTMDLGGEYQKRDVGTYSLTVAPKTGFTWPDTTTAEKTIQWSITKVKGAITFNKENLDFSEGITDSFIVSLTGGGTITAISDDTSVATVAVDNSTVTVTAIASGTTTIRVNATSENYDYDEATMVIDTGE